MACFYHNLESIKKKSFILKFFFMIINNNESLFSPMPVELEKVCLFVYTREYPHRSVALFHSREIMAQFS